MFTAKKHNEKDFTYSGELGDLSEANLKVIGI